MCLPNLQKCVAVVFLVVTSVLLPVAAFSRSAPVLLTGNTPAALHRAALVGHSDPNRVLDIVVGLNLHSEQELRNLIARQSDPASPDYHRFLTPTEFNQRFAPTPAEAQAVSRYLESQGLQVLQVTPNRLLVQARGSVAQVEAAFEVKINDYTLKGERHFSNDRDPSVPVELSTTVKSVAGLTSFGRFHSMAQSSVSTPTTPLATYTPHQIAAAYNFPNPTNLSYGKTAYDGTGTTIAIVPAIYYNSSDVDFFWQYYGITRTGSISTVLVNGGGGTTADVESTLDVEQIGSQAPGANIVAYSVPATVTNNGFGASVSFTDIELAFSQAVTDNTADSVSTSFVGCEAVVGNIQSIEPVLQQGVAQGISFFVGTGDSGAYAQEGGCSGTTLAVNYPSSSEYETAVGGTTLNLLTNSRYSSETAWSLSGGGQSSIITQPTWQVVTGVPTNGTRDIADVAFDADPNTGYYEYYQGGWYYEGGTSFGGPNWAALWALGVQALNGARTGNAAPSIYRIGGNDHHTYSSTFHDVTSGNNGYYNATTGWDYPTGWGSPNGAHLVNWIKKYL